MARILRAGSQILKAGGAPSNGLLKNLVAYWPLNEAAGANNALDLHASGLTLTQTGSPDATTGKVYATARTFNGSNQYFTRSSEAAIQTGGLDLTVAVWAYKSVTDSGELITKSGEFEMYWANGKIQFLSYGTTTYIVEQSITLNAWHLIAAWNDRTTKKIYVSIDNATPAELAATTEQASSTKALQIGAMDNLYIFNGRIGPAMLWKSSVGGGGVLTAAQRTALYNAGAGLAYSAFTA